MELARKILLEVEKHPSSKRFSTLMIDGYSSDVVAWHCELLYNNELLDYFKANRADNLHYYTFWVGHLTRSGTEYLDTIRDENF